MHMIIQGERLGFERDPDANFAVFAHHRTLGWQCAAQFRTLQQAALFAERWTDEHAEETTVRRLP